MFRFFEYFWNATDFVEISIFVTGILYLSHSAEISSWMLKKILCDFYIISHLKNVLCLSQQTIKANIDQIVNVHVCIKCLKSKQGSNRRYLTTGHNTTVNKTLF